MNANNTVEGEVAGKITVACLEVLRDNGYVWEAAAKRSLGKIIRGRVFNSYFGTVKPTKPESIQVQRMVTQDLLDKMTLEWALSYAEEGFKNVFTDDSLNVIRFGMLDVLLELEYVSKAEQGKMFEYMPVRWKTYEPWKMLARKCGLSATEVERALYHETI